MKKLWNSLRGLSGNNRGSGIVVVLVSMVCVALMGASLLFMSYTALRMRATERQASRDFYSAETAMDEIRAGVQSIASDAIADAYKSILETYSTSTLIDKRFVAAFVDALEDHQLLTDSGHYNKDTLESYISAPSSVVQLSCSGEVDDDDENVIVLEDICVTYTAANGYTTQISTDISIGMPDFAYTMSSTSSAGLPQHALIANEALEHTVGSSSIAITGSAYVGSMDLRASGSQMNISKGTLVCANDATISGRDNAGVGRLVTANDVKFWAGRIDVKGDSSISLSGETRVLDDLELSGGEAKAVLKGSYYGFGDEKNAPAGVNPAKYSSAILVNGLNSVLDLSGLDRLMLAGRGYVSDTLYTGASGYSPASGIGMLESVAVRSNQQMYLIDPADLKVDLNRDGRFEDTETVDQNPFVITVPPDSTDSFLEKDGGDYKYIRLSASGAGNAVAHDFKLTAREYSAFGSTGQKIIYCFMEFQNPREINAYFENRFSTVSGQLNSYLVDDTDEEEPIVVEKSNLNAYASYTSGYTIRGNNGVYALSQPVGTQFSPDGMLATFNQLKKTLIDANATVDADTTPYTYIVDTDKVKALGEGVSKTFSCTVGEKTFTGVVVNNRKNDADETKLAPYVINVPDDSPLRLVIASGDVTISSNYKGLVISGGNITLNGNSMTVAASDNVKDVFNATAADGDILKNYLLHGDNANTNPDTSDSAVGWKLDTLVTYKNWTKN